MTMEHTVHSQRAWARVAGLMYLVTLVVDMTGMQVDSATISRWLLFAGSWCVVLLALGLYKALRPVGAFLAGWALGLRLLEASLGVLSTTVGFAGVHKWVAGTGLGVGVIHLAQWDHAAQFSAFVFTIGSTIFFYLFVRSGYLPRVLAWWGLFSSVWSMAACATHLVRPSFPAMTMSVWVPMLIAETSTGLWLLIKSVRVENSLTAAAPPAEAAMLRAG